jgi:hypothetical protein
MGDEVGSMAARGAQWMIWFCIQKTGPSSWAMRPDSNGGGAYHRMDRLTLCLYALIIRCVVPVPRAGGGVMDHLTLRPWHLLSLMSSRHTN